jgi:hypothetical protein
MKIIYEKRNGYFNQGITNFYGKNHFTVALVCGELEICLPLSLIPDLYLLLIQCDQLKN